MGEIHLIAPMASHRNAGFPRMVQSSDRLIFAWTDTLADTPTVRAMSMSGG
jgi:hypothetical protein